MTPQEKVKFELWLAYLFAEHNLGDIIHIECGQVDLAVMIDGFRFATVRVGHTIEVDYHNPTKPTAVYHDVSQFAKDLLQHCDGGYGVTFYRPSAP